MLAAVACAEQRSSTPADAGWYAKDGLTGAVGGTTNSKEGVDERHFNGDGPRVVTLPAARRPGSATDDPRPSGVWVSTITASRSSGSVAWWTGVVGKGSLGTEVFMKRFLGAKCARGEYREEDVGRDAKRKKVRRKEGGCRKRNAQTQVPSAANAKREWGDKDGRSLQEASSGRRRWAQKEGGV